MSMRGALNMKPQLFAQMLTGERDRLAAIATISQPSSNSYLLLWQWRVPTTSRQKRYRKENSSSSLVFYYGQ